MALSDNPDLKKEVEKMLVDTTRLESCREAVILWLSTKNSKSMKVERVM